MITVLFVAAHCGKSQCTAFFTLPQRNFLKNNGNGAKKERPGRDERRVLFAAAGA
jgi:hypothetical protein